MTRPRKTLVILVGVLAPALVWLAASAQTPAVPAWVSDPQVYAAAKKEGAVVHYCTLPQAYCEDIGRRFEGKLKFGYSGPWPPYNFVTIRLQLERSAGV